MPFVVKSNAALSPPVLSIQLIILCLWLSVCSIQFTYRLRKQRNSRFHSRWNQKDSNEHIIWTITEWLYIRGLFPCRMWLIVSTCYIMLKLSWFCVKMIWCFIPCIKKRKKNKVLFHLYLADLIKSWWWRLHREIL